MTWLPIERRQQCVLMGDPAERKEQLDSLGIILRQTFGKSEDSEWASFRADYAEVLMKLDEPSKKQ